MKKEKFSKSGTDLYPNILEKLYLHQSTYRVGGTEIKILEVFQIVNSFGALINSAIRSLTSKNYQITIVLILKRKCLWVNDF